MKTPLLPHQVTALSRMRGRTYYGLLMEQGTGKTLVLLVHLLREYSAGRIEGVLVLAPNSVQINWVSVEIPKHVPDFTHIRSAYWVASPNKKEAAAIDSLFERTEHGAIAPLRVFAMNFEAVASARGFEAAKKFLSSLSNAAIVVDESHRIKSSKALTTRNTLKLRKFSSQRYIASGTPIGNSPLDAFTQFEFLESGLLGTTSEVVFRAEYCELLPENHGLMRHIVQRLRAQGKKFTPAIPYTDKEGHPIYKNLDKLRQLIEPHSFRVLKSECLKLPPKIYKTALYHPTKRQLKVYKELMTKMRFEANGNLETFIKLVVNSKVCQVLSGFIHLPDGTTVAMEGENPRLDTLIELVQDHDSSPILIWCELREEIEQITLALHEKKYNPAVIHGGVKPTTRRDIAASFQKGETTIIVSQGQTGKEGITLNVAETVIYYSSRYSYLQRAQSEDRAHRIGTEKPVTYIDIAAIDTIDQHIAAALQRKEDISSAILGDFAHT